MDLSKVRLVVTDMDGTLLDQNNEVSPRFFKQFKELKKRNIHFAAASGRQYQSILSKLDSIKNDISIIGENGGIMQYKNQTKVLLQLTNADVVKCVELLRTVNDCYIVLCGRNAAYVETNNVRFIEHLSKYYSVYEVVEDLTEVLEDEFLKIAVYHFESSEDFVFPCLNPLKEDYQVIVSGQNWLDISHKEANKAYALKILQENLGVSDTETLVFGDYNNDLGMLRLAYYSFAMANAHPNVKIVARYETKSNSEEGVEYILEKLLDSIESKTGLK